MSKAAKITITSIRPPADPVGHIPPVSAAPLPAGGSVTPVADPQAVGDQGDWS